MSSVSTVDHPIEKPVSNALTELALDLKSSFNRSANKMWEQLDPELWELALNPWFLLQTVSLEKLQNLTIDPGFQSFLADLHHEKKIAEESESWFQRTHPSSGISTIATFSMEFMPSESLPIYSGGFGDVTGDQLNAPRNLGVPVIGISCFSSFSTPCSNIRSA